MVRDEALFKNAFLLAGRKGKPRIRNFQPFDFLEQSLEWDSPNLQRPGGLYERIWHVIYSSDFSFFLAASIAMIFGVVHVGCMAFFTSINCGAEYMACVQPACACRSSTDNFNILLLLLL
jgi:hypothetical protein